ncbi:MAG: DUF4140 domain-containing protein, partial [Sphingobacteriales bacterium]
MKHTRLLFIFLLLPLALSAQTKQKVKIRQATVFLSGAELFSDARISLPQGESEVLFSNIAGNVNQQSLTIGANNQVVVQSATFQNNYLLEEISSPAMEILQDSLETTGQTWTSLSNRLATINEQ